MALFGNQMQPAKPMTDAEQLAQLMQGNLAGQLSGSDKLMALSALLRSVSRGRTQTPEQALQGFQQQKMQEVQGRIQIEQYRKAAERKAQLDALKAEYVSNAPNPQAARELQLMSDEDFSAFLRERNKPQGMDYTSQARGLIEAGIAPGTPAFQAARQVMLGTPTAFQTAQGTQVIPGVQLQETAYKGGKKYTKINGNWYLAE